MMNRAALAVVCAAVPLAAPAQDVRVQVDGGRTYFAVRLKAPDDLRLPRAQRQALDRIAPHDLGRFPRLVPQDDAAHRVAWHFAPDAKTLEFLGRAGSAKAGRFKLLYPVETPDKPPRPDWKELDVTLDFAAAAKVALPAQRDRRKPAEDDLEGRWAAAWARELAVRERLAADAPELRVARQELCRKYDVADPLPRPAPPRESGERTVDIREIRGIEPAEHPWQALLAGREPAVEPLARVVPADFYYLRVRTPAAGVALLDQFQRWAGVAAGIWDGAGRDHRLRERYWRQLALPLDEHGRPRWPGHFREAAVAGSDLHFRMGTDLTMVFAMSDESAFRAELAAARKALGELRAEQSTHEGIAVDSFTSADGSVRAHLTTVGSFAVVSNSSAALRRVIDVVRRKGLSVADAPEFQLMRCLFPPESPAEDVLAFFTEAFQREQFGPRHRILLRRRAAEIEQTRAGRAAALFAAWDAGTPPAAAAPLTSPPLIERGLDRITKAEDEFYQEYREYHRTELAPYLAPAALRFQALRGAVRAEAFVMAPRQADFWDALRNKLGKGTVARESAEYPGTAARVVASFTPGPLDRARLNNWLIARGVDKKHLAHRVEWLGDRWALHLADGPALANLVEHHLHADLTADDLAKSRGDFAHRWLIAQLPMTLAVEIARPLFFQGTLKKVREIVAETWPKSLKWEVLPDAPRRVKVERVQPQAALVLLAFGKLLKPEESPGIYLAHDARTLLLAPSLDTLRAGIGREMAPGRREARERAAAWLTVNPGASGLQTYLRQYAERAAHRQALAAATLRQWLHECGIAGDEDALRRLGYVPTAPDRTALRHDAARGEFVNERHGPPRAPRLHEPAADSPWLQALADFARLRGELHVRPDGLLGILMIER